MALKRQADLETKLRPRANQWLKRLPTLRHETVVLRELRTADAGSLLAHINQPAVGRFVAVPPASIEEFRRFIRWTQRQRRAGLHVCFGVIPAGERQPIGVIQVWSFEPSFATAEWGFALSQNWWGTGIFDTAARMALEFAFTELGVRRLEARSVDANGRGNTALCKLGAVPEGRLRNDFRTPTAVRDHVLWAILREDWQARRKARRAPHAPAALALR